VNNGSTTADPESAWDEPAPELFDRSSSGGGFSNYFKVPAYQAEVTSNYIKKFAPPTALFNRTGVSSCFGYR